MAVRYAFLTAVISRSKKCLFNPPTATLLRAQSHDKIMASMLFRAFRTTQVTHKNTPSPPSPARPQGSATASEQMSLYTGGGVRTLFSTSWCPAGLSH